MSNLPTNYVDDVLNADVNTRRKYQMIQNSDGTVSFNDVTDYDTVGSSIGAAQINAQNTKINQNSSAISTLNADLTAYYDKTNNKWFVRNADGTKGSEINMGIPFLDYGHPVATIPTSGWKATEDCYIFFGGSNALNTELRIDGQRVFQSSGYITIPEVSSTQNGYGACMFPIKKGQTVTHNANFGIPAFRAL